MKILDLEANITQIRVPAKGVRGVLGVIQAGASYGARSMSLEGREEVAAT